MKFIHRTVRLNASITQAMRFFLLEKEVTKWLAEKADVVSKKGGKYHLDLVFNEKTWQSHTILLEKDFERMIKFDMITPEAFQSGPVEVNFMPCTSKTEYCTEIHLVHKNIPIDEQNEMNDFWATKLEELRQIFNKDWVIEDRDLILSVLKGSF